MNEMVTAPSMGLVPANMSEAMRLAEMMASLERVQFVLSELMVKQRRQEWVLHLYQLRNGYVPKKLTPQRQLRKQENKYAATSTQKIS